MSDSAARLSSVARFALQQSIAEFGCIKTLAAVQALYDQDYITLSGAQAAAKLIRVHYKGDKLLIIV